jgi:hypothetical protein
VEVRAMLNAGLGAALRLPFARVGPLRRLRRRWRTLAVVGSVLVLLSGGLVAENARFPADVEPLAGTPFELVVQSGVPVSDVDGIRAGLRVMDGYLRDEVGVGVDGPVQVRVSWSHGCRALLRPGSVSTGWVDGPHFMCINAAHPRWKPLVEGHAYFPAYLAAHEHVHNLQAQLGCFAGSEHHEWQWLFEGMATQLAYAALVDADLVTAQDAELAIWEYRGLQDDNGTLADYERSSDEAGDAYGLFHLGARGLFERVESPRAFAEFCRATAAGTPWRDAFERSFGVTVAEHYDTVEQERSRLRVRQASAPPTDRVARDRRCRVQHDPRTRQAALRPGTQPAARPGCAAQRPRHSDCVGASDC